MHAALGVQPKPVPLQDLTDDAIPVPLDDEEETLATTTAKLFRSLSLQPPRSQGIAKAYAFAHARND